MEVFWMRKEWKKKVDEIVWEWNDEVRFDIGDVHSPPSLSIDKNNEEATFIMEIKTGDGIDEPYYDSPEEVDMVVDDYTKRGWSLVEERGLMRWETGEERSKWLEFEKTVKIPKHIKTKKQLINFLKKKVEE